jgi:type VI secretion system protein ImpA
VFGSVSFKDLEIAEGKAKPRPDKEPLDQAAVNAAFMDCPMEELSRAAHSAAAVFDELQALVADLSEHVQATDIPRLDSLQDLLGSIRAELQLRLNERQPAAAIDGTPSVSNMAAPSDIAPPGAAPTQRSHIGSRDEVVRSLDALCEYYRRHEPSSPVPLLLQRARRLATMEFLDIMRDLVPEAMDKLSVIKGPNSDDS